MKICQLHNKQNYTLQCFCFTKSYNATDRYSSSSQSQKLGFFGKKNRNFDVLADLRWNAINIPVFQKDVFLARIKGFC